MLQSLVVNEIFLSIQGESSFSGLPCTFIRLTGCNLNCIWCDSAYARDAGQVMSLTQIFDVLGKNKAQLVEVTGGEPLKQAATPLLLEALTLRGYRVLLETSGSLSVQHLPQAVHIIMDIKCPGSGMEQYNLLQNLEYLKETDEVKFVITDRRDFDWAVDLIRTKSLETRVNLLMSPVQGAIAPKTLVKWMLEKRLHCRFNLQLHKIIWGPDAKGV